MSVSALANSQLSVPLSNNYQPIEFEDRERRFVTVYDECNDVKEKICRAMIALTCGIGGLTMTTFNVGELVFCPDGCCGFCCGCCWGLGYANAVNMVAPCVVPRDPQTNTSTRRRNLILMALGIAIVWASLHGGGRLIQAASPAIGIPVVLGGFIIGGVMSFWGAIDRYRNSRTLPLEMTSKGQDASEQV